MKTTAAALRELQDYFSSLEPKPNIREIAKAAKMPYATAARYLNGTTQQGIPSRVRALALALDREDIMAEVTAETPTKNADAWWIVELQKEWREDNLEELERERKLREDSEKRWISVVAGKDKSIDLLTARIAKLEEDKTVALTDKERIYGEMAEVRRTKRKRDVMLIIALVLIAALLAAIIAYLIKFDLSTPEYGLFG